MNEEEIFEKNGNRMIRKTEEKYKSENGHKDLLIEECIQIFRFQTLCERSSVKLYANFIFGFFYNLRHIVIHLNPLPSQSFLRW